MDFGEILYAAQRNEHQAKLEPVKCYRTTFDPPKKENKSKALSSNIQKFLARKEEEEKRKAEEARKKRDELLALRSQDGMARKRVQAMLKRTKAANKSVIDDAIDEDNTAVTLGGPSQPDEDDYGYVSQEASALYNKLMDKYKSAPAEEPLFPERSSKPIYKDLNSTKDRVKAALEREKEEEMMPHKRKRKSKDKGKEADDGDTTINYSGSDMRDLNDNCRYRNQDEEEEFEEEEERPPVKPTKPKRPAPPPMDFYELLKLAEKKQFEPIKVEPKVKEEEDERPMTKKQKLEYLKEQEWRRRKEEANKSGGNRGMPPGRIPKLNEGSKEEKRIELIQRISKVSNRDERHSDGGQRISKVNGGRDERQNDTGQRIPKVDGGRDDKQVDSGQRIPKLSNRDERQNDSGSRISKVNSNIDDRQNDSGQRIPKVSNNRDARLSDSGQRVPKLNRLERQNDSGYQTPRSNNGSGNNSKYERQDDFGRKFPKVNSGKQNNDSGGRIPKFNNSGSFNSRDERHTNNGPKSFQGSSRDNERLSDSSFVKNPMKGEYQSDSRERNLKLTSKNERSSDSHKKNSKVSTSNERTPKGSDGRREETPNRIQKLNDSRGDRSSLQQKIPSREDQPKASKQNGMISRSDRERNFNGRDSKVNLKTDELFYEKPQPKLIKSNSDDSVSKTLGSRDGKSQGQDRSNIGGMQSTNSLRQLNSDQRKSNVTSSKIPQLSGYNKKLQESLAAKLQERKEIVERNKKAEGREFKTNNESKNSTKLLAKFGSRDLPSAKQGNERTVDNVPARKDMTTNRPNTVGPRSVSGGGLPARVQSVNKPQQNDRGKVQSVPSSMKPKQVPPPDVKSRQFPPPDVRPKQFPPADVRSRQFPPADVRRKQFPPADVRRNGKPPLKRRIIDSDEEYDSEMDDFIDDGPEEGEDYSRHIKEIFGYDKSRYRDYEDDDECMESSFAQQLKEEFVSTKLGILEDLEDIQKEQMEKKMKAMKKKKRKL